MSLGPRHSTDLHLETGGGRFRRRLAAAAVAMVVALLAGCAEDAPTEIPFVDAREPCADRNELRNLYWGDLHVHTAYSFDAYINDVRVDPAQAYRFARGEPVKLPPLDASGEGTQTLAIERPLDFAAVTDHGEYLAEVDACVDPSSAVFDTEHCAEFRGGGSDALVAWGMRLGSSDPKRFDVICDVIDCGARVEEVWTRVAEAAEAAYDRTEACAFTSFVGYEWTGADKLSNLHRNVIFRSSEVPARPVTHFEEPTPQGLWARLQSDCIDASSGINGCDALAIPHNSNWSNGKLFIPEYPQGPEGGGAEAEVEAARLRAKLEPLVEILQHKGDSECSNGVSGILGNADEECDFEKLRFPPFEDCAEGVGDNGMIGKGCVSRWDFVRGVLLEGLKEERRIGVNPYALGLMASTDTHNGTPGAVEERGYLGHVGRVEALPGGRLTGMIPGGPRNNPGGLIAVWATENSRDALFDAMRNKETYGTSGPRMAVRFFGGWEYPEDACDSGSFVELGYEEGVPMGGALLPAPSGVEAPVFMVFALADLGTAAAPGLPLERVQIIKGWLDAQGEGHVQVYDVAGEKVEDSVDPLTCEATLAPGVGRSDLCAVWRDPDFDPDAPSWYYVRLLEVPTCRWSAIDCVAMAPDDRPAACEDLPSVIRERAWTSPIWYGGP